MRGEFTYYVIRAPKLWGWKYYHKYLPKRLRLWLARKFGTIEKPVSEHNIIVNGAFPVIVKRLGGLTQNPLGYIAVATNVPAGGLSYTDTALTGEVYRVASSNSTVTTTYTNDTLRAEASISITASYTIKVAGTFDASTGGTLISEAELSPYVSVQNGDTLIIIYKLVASR